MKQYYLSMLILMLCFFTNIHAQDVNTPTALDTINILERNVDKDSTVQIDNIIVTESSEIQFSSKINLSNQAPFPSQGFSFKSLWRGVLGMISLIFIAFLFSKNRKGINWRTVGLGLGAQVLLAIGVLKVSFIQLTFEWVGGRFVDILNFTMAGTEFLFNSFISKELESSLINFAITILPTIIFFSALTSVLFYLGVIQKIVKGLAWLLTKLLQISGAESLSVAGNIFLGQT